MKFYIRIFSEITVEKIQDSFNSDKNNVYFI